MNKFELEKRTKRFALKIIEFVGTLPRTKAGAVIEYQLVKAGTAARELLAIFTSIGKTTKANRAHA